MYIPKNKIVTNLYSNTNQLLYKNSKTIYNGFYWKSYDGKLFTGKNPNDIPTLELISIESPDDQYDINDIKSKKSILTTNIESPEPVGDNVYNEQMVIKYSKLKNTNVEDYNYKLIPSIYYPAPTEIDYNLGVFDRYFVVKVNQNIYTEINSNDYNNMISKNNQWMWESYISFIVPWTIIGEEDVIYEINRNIVLLTEKKINRRGLQEFLKFNYTKFMKK